MIKQIVRLFSLLTVAMMFASCHTVEKIVYLQDVKDTIEAVSQEAKLIKIQPEDKISVIVTSRDPKMSAIYNLPIATFQAGTTNTSSYNQIQGYTVNQQGDIDIPNLGKVHVAGLTRSQIETKVKQKLIDDGQLQDAVVNVDYMNLRVSILGEVAHPGKFNVDRDELTLVDALSMAGDLNITGKRDGVLVIREENGKRITHYVDLRSKKLFESPLYYLQQNDIVYVQPNKMRAGQSTVNDNTLQSASMWVSIASLLASLGTLLFK